MGRGLVGDAMSYPSAAAGYLGGYALGYGIHPLAGTAGSILGGLTGAVAPIWMMTNKYSPGRADEIIEKNKRAKKTAYENRNRYDVFGKVKKIVSKRLGAPYGDITPKANFVTDLRADSLDIVDIVMDVEEEFGIEIPDYKAKSIKTVQSLVDYISANQRNY